MQSAILLWMNRISFLYFIGFQLTPFFTTSGWLVLQGIPDWFMVIFVALYFFVFGVTLGNAFSKYGNRTQESKIIAYVAVFLFFFPISTLLRDYLRR